MLFSMTGFSSLTREVTLSRGRTQVTVEARSVNSRYLDVSSRSSRGFSAFEMEVTQLAKKILKRGRIEVYLDFRVLESKDAEITVHRDQVTQMYRALEGVRSLLQISTPLTMSDLLRVPDWIEVAEQRSDRESDVKVLEPVIEEALRQLVSAREKEGAQLSQLLRTQTEELTRLYQTISQRKAAMLEAYRKRFQEKLRDLLQESAVNEERLHQEVVFWVGRADFEEEVDRMGFHLKEISDVLDRGGEAGRRLDFLVQELHREVNTFASKCPEVEGSRLGVEMKTWIERMREQIQNVE